MLECYYSSIKYLAGWGYVTNFVPPSRCLVSTYLYLLPLYTILRCSPQPFLIYLYRFSGGKYRYLFDKCVTIDHAYVAMVMLLVFKEILYVTASSGLGGNDLEYQDS